jgi:hypothetical protein
MERGAAVMRERKKGTMIMTLKVIRLNKILGLFKIYGTAFRPGRVADQSWQNWRPSATQSLVSLLSFAISLRDFRRSHVAPHGVVLGL